MTYAKFATVPCAMLAALLLCRCGAIAANIEKCDKCGKPIMLGASHICFKRPSTPSAQARKAQGGAAGSKENREPARAQPAKARTKRDAGDAELCFPSFSKEDIEALAKLFKTAQAQTNGDDAKAPAGDVDISLPSLSKEDMDALRELTGAGNAAPEAPARRQNRKLGEF